MFKRCLIIPLFFAVMTLCASAQIKHTKTYRVTTSTTTTSKASDSTKVNSLTTNKIKSPRKEFKLPTDFLNHLDLGVNLGTTGLGLTLQLPIGENVKVRTGFDYIPRTSVPMTFDLMSYAGVDDDATLSDEQKFDNLSELMESFTGVKIDREIDMHAHGTTIDFKLLVDFYPLRDNKHWYATAGFFWGSSKVGHIENTITEAPSLMGVIMYNRLYDYFVNEEFFDRPLYGDMYIDPMVGLTIQEKFKKYGRVGAHVGNFKGGSPFAEGTPYMLQPDDDGTIHADMYVNSFKPYLGIGYSTSLSKDGRWNLGVDAGALFWGRPRINTHERYIYDSAGNVSYGIIPEGVTDLTYGPYIDLAKDVDDISGKVGTYVGIAKAMHVFPVLNLRITYKLF